jgi:hypothetical protein
VGKLRTFKLNRDTGITIYTPWRPTGFRLEPGAKYATEDKDEIEALRAQPDVTEVKGKK